MDRKPDHTDFRRKGRMMSIITNLGQVDWAEGNNKKIAGAVYADACEYWKRVIAHIYEGNEIRADMWMDFSEKQDAIKTLDRKRTEAHNKLLISAADFIELISKETEFDRSEYRLDTRTQIADFIAGIAFELMEKKPSSGIEGNARDELAEILHNGIFSKKLIYDRLCEIMPGVLEDSE